MEPSFAGGKTGEKMAREWLAPGPIHLEEIGVGFLVCWRYRLPPEPVRKHPEEVES
jgi:hypothetical protein